MIFQIVLLLLLITFYTLYFVKMFLLKRKSISVDLLGKGNKPGKAIITEVILKIITYLGAAIKSISVIFPNLIWSFDVPVHIRAAGVILATTGVVFFALSITIMRDNWRAGFNEKQNTSLVTKGAYKISRNPAFVGFDLLYIGCAMAFPNIAMISIAVIAIIGFHVQILGEENFLEEKFEREYIDYKNNVRRYL